ncbi:hypothetical protein DSL92_01600 [Billgrantia gudaonensis]|uniref:DUF3459 domain-containing protein n=1 Tax=Billgrantia gudaonensis TaxID=376427 RepID=A0A3S0NEK2_9GAMM|nr:hypothetical protein DSL92_01600 [Halomonas gudaonensis]
MTFARLQDPTAKTWPEFRGATAATPMPWTDAPAVSPADASPCPEPTNYRQFRASRRQRLGAQRHRRLAFRQKHPALIDGELSLVDVGEELLGFIRQGYGERLLCVFNLDSGPTAPSYRRQHRSTATVSRRHSTAASDLPYQAAFIELDH